MPNLMRVEIIEPEHSCGTAAATIRMSKAQAVEASACVPKALTAFPQGSRRLDEFIDGPAQPGAFR